MESGLVTVVVAIYNVEKYLKKCIESIIDQKYKKIEIILVNDGSEDSSLDICKQYLNDDRVSIIDKKNEGLSSVRQAGIDNANGEYICMIDSDDYIEKNFVKKMYSKISADKSDICVCSTRFYSENYNHVYGFSEKISTIAKITKRDIEFNYNSLLNQYYMSDSWNKIYSINFIRSAGVRFSLSAEYNGTDLSFNHQIMLNLPQISVLSEPLYNHQILENSRVRRKNKQLQKGFMIIMSQIISEVEKHKYSNIITRQLNCLYVAFLRQAAQDIFNSKLDSKELKDKFNEFHKENERYLYENKRLNLNSRQMNSLSLKFFCCCLKSRSSTKMFSYLSFRKKILALRGVGL